MLRRCQPPPPPRAREGSAGLHSTQGPAQRAPVPGSRRQGPETPARLEQAPCGFTGHSTWLGQGPKVIPLAGKGWGLGAGTL